MKIYDKASWHIDAGESSKDVLEKLKTVMVFLHNNNLLSDDGEEILGIGLDSSFSLHERMVNDRGNAFLDAVYDRVICLKKESIQNTLEALLSSGKY